MELQIGKIIQGSVFYRLWKSTLQYWFSKDESKVHIITPYIDVDRLTDICMLFLENKLIANVETICIPLSSLYGSFAEVKQKTLKKFSARDQATLEYKLFCNVVYPSKDFSSSLIANVRGQIATILNVNTNFDRENFVTSKCSSCEVTQIDERTFFRRYLDPIIL